MFDWEEQRNFINVDAIVERCTSDMLFQPDYEQNLALVDKLNSAPNLLHTYMTAIQRRMANPSEEIVLTLTVTLLDTILKNCPGALEEWGKREFQETVLQTAITTKFLRAREVLLELIQLLGISYQGDQSVYYGRVYKSLIAEHKISFPKPPNTKFEAPSKPKSTTNQPPSKKTGHNNDQVPLHQSARQATRNDNDPFPFLENTYDDDGDPSGQYEAVKSAPPSKRRATEASIEEQLDSLSSNVSLLTDVLGSMDPKENIMQNELVTSILPIISSVHENIIKILQGDTTKLSEDLVARIFSANDAAIDILAKVDARKKGSKPNGRPNIPPPVAAAAPVAPPPPSMHGNVDMDGDEFALLATRKRPITHIKSASLPVVQSEARRISTPSPFDLYSVNQSMPMPASPILLQPQIQQPPAPQIQQPPSSQQPPNQGSGGNDNLILF